MQLLVCVINDRDKLEDILAGFLEIGITGATVIDSRGMGRLLQDDVPAFGNLRSLTSLTRDDNATVFSVVETQERLEAAQALVKDLCGDLETPSTGIMFTVPVSGVVGLASKLSVSEEEV